MVVQVVVLGVSPAKAGVGPAKAGVGPGKAGLISKAIKTVVFLECFLPQRWLDFAPEVAGLCSRGGWTLLQRWLDFAPEVAGLNRKILCFSN